MASGFRDVQGLDIGAVVLGFRVQELQTCELRLGASSFGLRAKGR